MKKWLRLASVVALVSVVGYFLVASEHRAPSLAGEVSLAGVTRPSPAGASAVWASQASSVAEVLAEADLVVRTKTMNEPESRLVSFTGPLWAEDGTVTGRRTETITFSDTQMEVLAIYKGGAKRSITVMQTGGISQGIGGTVEEMSFADDPLYVVGEESILFLVDISHDAIHAGGRTLYRVVNPAGRYTIQGSQVFSRSEVPVSSRPKTVDELLQQMEEAEKE